MKAKFEVRSTKQRWKPPFTKEITDDVFEVEEGESFDSIRGNGNNEKVYTYLSNHGDKVVVKYSKLFTLKTPNPGDQKLVLNKDEPISMTYMWGEDGVSKKITYKGNA